jgi:hypothetical protein
MIYKRIYEVIIYNCMNNLTLEYPLKEIKNKEKWYKWFINYMIIIDLPSKPFTISSNKVKDYLFNK